MKLAYGMMVGALALVGCGQAPADKPAQADPKAEEQAQNTAPAQTPPSEAKTDTAPQGESGAQIRIATESNYKPFSYLDNQGKHQGFEIDLIHALCTEMKADCVISSQDWASLIPGL